MKRMRIIIISLFGNFLIFYALQKANAQIVTPEVEVRETTSLWKNEINGTLNIKGSQDVTNSTNNLVNINPTYSLNGSGSFNKMGLRINMLNSMAITGIDDGYRMGLDVSSYLNNASLSGTLDDLYGIRVQVGAHNGATGGTINRVRGITISGLENSNVTIGEKFGLYQKGVNYKNYFQGSVGLGVESPQAKLHVDGASGIRISEGDAYMMIRPNHDVSSLNPGQSTVGALITNRYLGHLIFDVNANDKDDAFAIRTDSDYNGAVDAISFLVNSEGKVGIGTTNPTEKLHVNGKIRTAQNTWSDFVFSESYQLPSLQEVAAHIEENGHLKDIPSEEEILSEGYVLGDMDAKLLQKIEELTLYLIDQNRRLEKLELENMELREKMQVLEERDQ